MNNKAQFSEYLGGIYKVTDTLEDIGNINMNKGWTLSLRNSSHLYILQEVFSVRISQVRC